MSPNLPSPLGRSARNCTLDEGVISISAGYYREMIQSKIAGLDEAANVASSRRKFIDIFEKIVSYCVGRPINVVSPQVLEPANRRR
jgi:hypothetical protein